jgi:hypothetical protein
MSNPSAISIVSSNNSLRYSDLTSSALSSTIDPSTTPATAHDIGEFDIIDSLDYDDIDDGLIGTFSIFSHMFNHNKFLLIPNV